MIARITEALPGLLSWALSIRPRSSESAEFPVLCVSPTLAAEGFAVLQRSP